MARLLNQKQWNESDDPVPMLKHLVRRGCTMDFTPLVDLFLIRVWRRVSDSTLRQVLYEWFGTGQTNLTQDEVNVAAEMRINELKKQLRNLDPSRSEHREVSHQIKLGSSLLVFDGTGFEETVTAVSRSMAAVADNPTRELKWQADTIRRLFDFDYIPPDE